MEIKNWMTIETRSVTWWREEGVFEIDADGDEFFPRPIWAKKQKKKWISVPTGSEETGFKMSRKNGFEETLFRLEDDRYEKKN